MRRLKKTALIFASLAVAAACLFTSCTNPGGVRREETPEPVKSGTLINADGVIFSDGSGYTVENHDGIENDLFVFGEGIDLKFKGGITEKVFNRFTIDYSATAPLEIFVKYTSGGDLAADNYYLEKGEKKTFSGILSNCIDGGTGSGISEISVRTLEGRSKFVVSNVSTETIDFPETDSDGNFYIENGRYKLGLRLAWGGGISYILDKNANVPGLSNLINQHDTGRLVQQSYYGTGPIEGVYDPGTFLDHVWVYNPVQGGDRFMTKSRLVDVTVGEDSVYIKTQPKDWGNNGLLLPCYMENKYTIYEDRIQVDNRFVDFSGFVHPYGLQELPAFYTVSYLDSLVYYNGREPWTDAGLIVNSSLTDWTKSDNKGPNTFDIIRGNTETWAAFVNLDVDFGIGVYTPNYEVLNAGRYEYDGTKDSMADPTNYIAPRSNLRIVKYEALEYSYLIASGSVSEMREVFKANKDFTFNPKLTLMGMADAGTDELYDFTNVDFTKEGSEKLFYNLHNTVVSYDEQAGCVKFEVTEAYDVYCGISLDNNSAEEMEADEYQVVEIEYMVPKSNSQIANTMELFLAAGDVSSAAAENSVFVSYVTDGNFHTARINLTAKEVWHGTIHMLRLDYFTDCKEGDVFYIRSMGFRKAEGRAEYENIDFTTAAGMTAIGNTIRTNAEYDADEKAAKLYVIDGNDVNVSINYLAAPRKLDAGDYDSFEIEYMIPKSNNLASYRFEMYFCTGSVTDPTEDNCARGSMKKDGEYHIINVPMSKFKTHDGKMIMLRFDYFSECVAGDVIYIKSIKLVRKQN